MQKPHHPPVNSFSLKKLNLLIIYHNCGKNKENYNKSENYIWVVLDHFREK